MEKAAEMLWLVEKKERIVDMDIVDVVERTLLEQHLDHGIKNSLQNYIRD